MANPTTSTGTITFPVASDPEGGVIYTFGNPASPRVVLLCAGFPDDHSAFTPFATRLANEADCFTGVTCLAGYDDRPERPWTTHKKDGYTFNEMSAALRDAGRALRAKSAVKEGKAKYTTIFHDWGVVIGMNYVNQAIEENDGPDDVVIFDVLLPVHPESENLPPPTSKSFYYHLVEKTYRIVFAQSFLLQRYVHKFVGLLNLVICMIVIKILGLSPLGKIDDKVHEERKPPLDLGRMLYMAYPYWHIMIKLVLVGKGPVANIQPDLDKVPLLYLYGTEKAINFHDEQAVAYIRQEGGKEGNKSDAIAVGNAGHYLYLQQEDVCIGYVKKFIMG